MTIYEIRHFLTESGTDVFSQWLEELDDPKTRSRIEIRLLRVERGILGDVEYLRDGVSEFKLDFGPGYRIYFGKEGRRIIILLCAGDKSTQKKDINRAIDYWKEYQARGD